MNDPLKIEFPDLGPIEIPTTLDDIPVDDPFLIAKTFVRREIAKKKFRKGLRKFVKPENAAAIIADFPREIHDTTHFLLRGDFILGDLLPPLAEAEGPFEELIITSLGISEKNAAMLHHLRSTGKTAALHLLLSNYFATLEKANLWLTVRTLLLPLGTRIGIAPIHTKIILIKTATRHYVLEGSANLRSCAKIEQLTIFHDPGLYQFHRDWILPIIEANLVTE